jgi:hypothetical protein
MRTLAVLSLYIAGALNFGIASIASASTDCTPVIGSSENRRSPLIEEEQNDPIRMVKLTAPKRCCGHYKRTKVRNAQQDCEVKVDVQYCYTRIVNNVPISFCYWTHQTVKGTLNPAKSCCAVTLKEINGQSYCVPPGSTITIGPIPMLQQSGVVPAAPPSCLIESYVGARKTLRIVPERRSPEEQSDVYVYNGDRLVIQMPESTQLSDEDSQQ